MRIEWECRLYRDFPSNYTYFNYPDLPQSKQTLSIGVQFKLLSKGSKLGLSHNKTPEVSTISTAYGVLLCGG